MGTQSSLGSVLATCTLNGSSLPSSVSWAAHLLSGVVSKLSVAKHGSDETYGFVVASVRRKVWRQTVSYILTKGQHTQLICIFLPRVSMSGKCQHFVGAASIQAETTLLWGGGLRR